ncbi:MAG: hypothetical protein HXX81_00090 [Campylobacterales bacterium]|nr:hypothetical protein [Campylobacterales bacterium]
MIIRNSYNTLSKRVMIFLEKKFPLFYNRYITNFINRYRDYKSKDIIYNNIKAFYETKPLFRHIENRNNK